MTLKCCRMRRWLPYLLPHSSQEESVLQESGISTPPNLPQSRKPQDPIFRPSSPASSPSASTASPPLRRLLDETSDLIDSPVFTQVLTLLLDAAFSHLIDVKVRTEAYKLTPLTSTPTPESRIFEVTDPDPLHASTKLANILAVLTREAHKMVNGVPNEYVQAIEAVNELEAFAALVYSSNFETEDRSKTIAPETAACGSKAETKGDGNDRKGPDCTATAKVEDVANVEKGGITDKASGFIDAAWGGFESVWAKVVGSGDSVMRG